VDKSLRETVETSGISVSEGAGFFLLSSEPDYDAEVFDLWDVFAPNVVKSGDPQMVRDDISPLFVNRIDRSFKLAVGM
jgi:hypothetical protein